MQAVGGAGGTLNINSALTNTGTLAANGGVVNANAAFTGTGTALITGTGQLNVGAASTVGTLTHNGSSRQRAGTGHQQHHRVGRLHQCQRRHRQRVQPPRQRHRHRPDPGRRQRAQVISGAQVPATAATPPTPR